MAAFSAPLRNKAQSLSRSSARLVPAICLLLPLMLLQNTAAQDVSAPENTQPLTEEGDLASLMVDGIDRFLLNEISKAAASRPTLWQLNQSSLPAFDESLKPHREQLAKEIGAHDSRLVFDAPTLTSSLGSAPEVSENSLVRVLPIRWPVLSHPSPQGQGVTSVSGEGLLLLPRTSIIADIIVIPDADQSPEQICGLDDSLPPDQQVARILANRGFRVVVPQLISRQKEKRNGRASLTSREYLHRSAFELGRTLAGYEVQSTLSLVDWFSKSGESRPICVAGYGEGGMISLFAAALDTRISTTLVSGFFGPRETSWSEPLDRNFAGLLQHAGAAELAMMIAPRTLIIDAGPGPVVPLPGDGGAPAELVSPDPAAAESLLSDAIARLEPLSKTIGRPIPFFLEKNSGSAIRSLCKHHGMTLPQDIMGLSLQTFTADQTKAVSQARELSLLKQIDLHNQALLHESPFVRSQFMSKLDTSSVQKYAESVESYRSVFRKEVIGEFDQPLLPFNAQSRKSWETDKWTGHEVRLEVFPDVFAYGVLLLPKGLKPGEKRPVVVCQHGLEGRPTDIFLNDHPAYHDFAAKLCERGFITFSPQNPYIFTDRFRTLQRKAQPLGKSLFSIIVPQHQQIVNWLKTQSFTDPDRIAFYGLSYGGKSAMRIPALVTDYCLSICSADFNEWVLKNASTRHNFSYVWTGEYEIFEWNLGSTFNYAEMAALICPRPFMVERGHFDGVGLDEFVAFEYAKVRFLYAAQLKIPERTEIEWFDGPHTINGQATYRFLHKHLKWPEPPQ